MAHSKKWGKLALVSVLAMSTLLTACSSNNAKEEPTNSAPTATAEGTDKTGTDSKYTAPFDGTKFDPPVTITTVRGVDDGLKFKNGETVEDNVHLKWAREKLGVNIDYLWTANHAGDAFNTKLRLALSSNSKMPDILVVGGDIGGELIESGKFMEVGELFDKYASESYKKAMNDDPNVWLPYLRDGKKMGIPSLNYMMNNDGVMWVRQDWLDKLKLEAPKTIEELEKVMDAFVNQDPDGNNKKDTFALSLGLKENLIGNMGGADWLFGAYGTIPNQWNVAEDGSLEHGSIQPEMKQGLEKLAAWMEKGYISQQTGLNGTIEAAAEFTSGKSGIIFGSHWMPEWPLNDLLKNVPDGDFEPYALPAGPDGKVGRKMYGAGGGVVLINKDLKHPDAFFVYQNYLFDHFANPEFGSEFEFGLAEGYDWAVVDGTPTNDPKKIPGGHVSVSKYMLTPDNVRIPSSRMEAYSRLAKDPTSTSPMDNFLNTKPAEVIKAAAIVNAQKDHAYAQMFVGPPTETQKLRGDFLSKMEQEAVSKIIYGDLPLDSFDAFVEKWKSSGGDKYAEEVNAWYKSVLGK